MDEIRIVDLEVFANHGVFPEENALGQKFIVNLVLRGDFSAACKSDAWTIPSIMARYAIWSMRRCAHRRSN